MPVLKSIKFSKLDPFNNVVFIASKKTDEENYNKLVEYHEKLGAKDFKTFLPLYHNTQHNYTTIRFYKNNKLKVDEKCKYDIDFTAKTKEKDGKKYINCYINKLVFVSKPEKFDEGEVLEL